MTLLSKTLRVSTFHVRFRVHALRQPHRPLYSVGHYSSVFASRPFSTAMGESTESLSVYNSLKPGAPVRFDPAQPGKVSWYACGPTVYDKSHLGHARNYVSTDIIRRIMMHYFGLDVNFVMNVTDIDDKVGSPRLCASP